MRTHTRNRQWSTARVRAPVLALTILAAAPLLASADPISHTVILDATKFGNLEQKDIRGVLQGDDFFR